jgi:hypothetical protein
MPPAATGSDLHGVELDVNPSRVGLDASTASRPRFAAMSVTFTGWPAVTTPPLASASSRSPCARTSADSNFAMVCASRKSIS